MVDKTLQQTNIPFLLREVRAYTEFCAFQTLTLSTMGS
jgi:hypothetical protein